MTKEQFIAHYAATFMASWSAYKYDDVCLMDQQHVLDHQPIEDALFLAEIAWTKYQENI